MNKIAVVATFMFCSTAYADEWVGPDKNMHFAGGALIGAAVTAAMRDERWGFAAGCGVGVLKEVYDLRHQDKHTPSWKDLAVTCAGAYVGSKITGWVLTSNSITYVHKF